MSAMFDLNYSHYVVVDYFIIIIIILVDIPVGIELSTDYWDQTNQTATYPCQ